MTAEIAASQVALLVRSWGWTADPIASDYGEDLECNLFAAEQRTNLYCRLQVKGTASRNVGVTRYANGDYRARISGSLCRQWCTEFFPVFLAIYDSGTNSIHWCDPVERLKANPRDLAKSSVIFRIGKDALLSEAKSKITTSIENSYAHLFRIEQPSLKCEIYPVLMPGYRSEPIIRKFIDRKAAADKTDLKVSDHTCPLDELPGWLTPVESLQAEYISGVSLSSSDTNVERFLLRQREFLLEAALPISSGTWLAFVTTPVRFEGRHQPSTGNGMLRNEITQWESVSLVGKAKLVRDTEYAFEPPSGLLRPIGRRARSWDGYFYVSRDQDFAIQLLAPTTPGPGDFAKSQLFKKAIHAQLLPWVCKKGEVRKVAKIVAKAELVFRQTPEVSCRSGKVAGVITPPMTDPNLGFFHMMMDWDEFDGGTRKVLKDAKVLDELPGREGGAESWTVLERMFSEIYESPPSEFFVNAHEHRDGLPLNLAKRTMVVSRFRRNAKLKEQLTLASKETRLLGEKVHSVAEILELRTAPIDGIDGPIAGITVVLRPRLSVSSLECFEQAKLALLDFLESICPGVAPRDCDTYAALHLDGELYFEGHERYVIHH